MNNKISSEDTEYIRNLMDLEHGPFMKVEDSLRYLFIRYVWQDQIPEDVLSDLGEPLPLPHDMSLEEFDRATPEKREAMLENLIYIYSCGADYCLVYVEALRRLLFTHFEYGVEVPEILQVWANKAALLFEPKFSRGKPKAINNHHRAHLAYQYLTRNYEGSDLYFHGFIADRKAELRADLNDIGSTETVRDAIKEAKNITGWIFDKRNPLRELVKNSRNKSYRKS